MATTLAQLFGIGGAQLLPKAGAAAKPAVMAQPLPAAMNPGAVAVLPPVGANGGAPEIPAETMRGLGAMSDAAMVLPPVSALPQVTNPLEQGIERQQALVGRDLTAPKTWQELGGWGKVGRVLGTIGGATRFAPFIPGTDANRELRTERDMGALSKLTGLQNEAQGQARAGEELGLQAQQGSRAERTLQAQLAENGLQMDAQGQISPLPPQQWSPKLRAEILPKPPKSNLSVKTPPLQPRRCSNLGNARSPPSKRAR